LRCTNKGKKKIIKRLNSKHLPNPSDCGRAQSDLISFAIGHNDVKLLMIVYQVVDSGRLVIRGDNQ